MKVDFLIAGTQKGGTTALGNHLRRHPDICMARVKEVHFFDQDKHFSKRDVNYSIYHSFFPKHSKARAFGEATPIYMFWQDAPKRIWEYNPDMKIILILRNPVDRAYSHWNMMRDRGHEKLSFIEAVRAEDNRSRQALPRQDRRFSYTGRGFYTEQLRRLWRYFPRAQTHIIRNDDLRENCIDTLNSIFEFIAVDGVDAIKEESAHVRSYAENMRPDDRRDLMNIFEYDIKQLERLLNWNCSD